MAALERDGYRILVQPPGNGFRHILTAADIRARLSQFPDEMRAALQVVQLSRMTRKKQSFPCYGMQWGTSLYLYPIEDSLVEFYHCPPTPNQVNEARMYGGRWSQDSKNVWRLETGVDRSGGSRLLPQQHSGSRVRAFGRLAQHGLRRSRAIRRMVRVGIRI